MSDVPLTRATLLSAKAATPQSRSRPLVRAKPLPQTETIVISCDDTGVRKREDVGPIIIEIDTTKPAVRKRTAWSGVQVHIGAGSATRLAKWIIREAPAWTVSMLVHMVTLVTMAAVAVPDPGTHAPPELVVTPAKEEKVEEIKEKEKEKEVDNEQPTTLLEDSTQLDAVTFESKLEQETKVDIQPSDDVEAGLAAVDLTEYGMEQVPKGDLLTMLGVYGSGLSGRGSASAKAQLVIRDGGSGPSEKAVASALRWLANHQLNDGGWSFDHARCPRCQGKCRNPGSGSKARNAATGLALLPFLGSGQTHLDGDYKVVVRRGLDYLAKNMHVGVQGGALNEPSPGNMYAHGLASIAMCEAYAMTHDKDLHEPAQRALDFICFAQDPKGGGWRYKPKEPGDTSMVGWQLMALKSGHMANLRVPALTVHRASLYLDSVQSDNGAAYSYQGNRSPGEATTAIGLLSRMYLGWRKDNPALQRGVKFLSRHGPSGANMYYNYYATQVMHHWEGEEWANWNRQMRDQLVHAQAKQGHEDGSWFSGTGDSGAGPGGRLYCTAMAAMILEVYYRHLPLYRSQSVNQDFPE
jgi:hypothetical protein